MSAIDVVTALADATNAMQWDAMAALMTDDFTATGLAPMPLGKQELIGGEQAWHVASPDRHVSVSQASEEGGTVKGILSTAGTQTGTLALPGIPAIPATGKHYSTTGNVTVTVRGGQVAALAFDSTTPDVLEQLGVRMP